MVGNLRTSGGIQFGVKIGGRVGVLRKDQALLLAPSGAAPSAPVSSQRRSVSNLSSCIGVDGLNQRQDLAQDVDVVLDVGAQPRHVEGGDGVALVECGERIEQIASSAASDS
jgi:hypothetical protein